MDERVPLLSFSSLSVSRYSQSFSSKVGSPILSPTKFDLDQKSKHCCRQINYCLSRFMLENPKFLLRIKYAFEIILVNSGLACLFILVMRICNAAVFQKWSKGYLSVLGGWNIQITNSLLIFSYALSDFLQLRIWLTIACISSIIFAITSPIGIMIDIGMFNFVMVLLNIRHAVVLVYKKRYIEFADEMEQIYTALFMRYMTRVQFKELVDIALIRSDQAKVTMKEEGDLVTSLCILVKGRVEVRRNDQLLNVLNKNDILEAPEWVKSNLDPEGTRFTVSFFTATDVVYVKFTREKLSRIIKKDPAIQSAVLAVLGIRISELWLRSLDRNVARGRISNPQSPLQKVNEVRYFMPQDV